MDKWQKHEVSTIVPKWLWTFCSPESQASLVAVCWLTQKTNRQFTHQTQIQTQTQTLITCESSLSYIWKADLCSTQTLGYIYKGSLTLQPNIKLLQLRRNSSLELTFHAKAWSQVWKRPEKGNEESCSLPKPSFISAIISINVGVQGRCNSPVTRLITPRVLSPTGFQISAIINWTPELRSTTNACQQYLPLRGKFFSILLFWQWRYQFSIHTCSECVESIFFCVLNKWTDFDTFWLKPLKLVFVSW